MQHANARPYKTQTYMPLIQRLEWINYDEERRLALLYMPKTQIRTYW
jgi:hypothetical protein